MNLDAIHQEFLEDEGYRAAYAEEDLIHRVAERVVKLRVAAKLSQRELAQLVGTQQPAIAVVEGGYVNLTLRRVARFALALGCDPECLISKEEPPELLAEEPDEEWEVRETNVESEFLMAEASAFEPISLSEAA